MLRALEVHYLVVLLPVGSGLGLALSVTFFLSFFTLSFFWLFRALRWSNRSRNKFVVLQIFGFESKTYILVGIEVPAPWNSSFGLFGSGALIHGFEAAIRILLRRSNFTLGVIELDSNKFVIFVTLIVNKLVFFLVI